MASMQESPPPVSELGVYRILSPRAAVRVSPLCLGAMSIGSAWEKLGLGPMSKEGSFRLLDEFVRCGGNFIDTANLYQEGESEKWIGEWMNERGYRDELVLATKYTGCYNSDAPSKIRVNYAGNAAKSLRLSVRDSLKKLQTNYIDILYLHCWDWTTSIEEVMQSLNVLVKEGKVLYLGVSDTPAWVVSKANQYARDHALAQFVIYQGEWSVMSRDFEREIIPMCVSEGMALCPWGAVGRGKFQSKADLEKRLSTGEQLRGRSGSSEQSELEVKVSAGLEKIGKELGTTSVTAVALAYVLQRVPYVFPIIGGRKIEHLHSNISSLSLQLTKDHVRELESLAPFERGFPYNQFGGDIALGEPTPRIHKVGGQIAFVQHSQAIKRAENASQR